MNSSEIAASLTLQQLKYFLAVAEHGSYRQMERLRRGQPAVSKGIRDLERLLGAQLFESTDRTTLTPFGSLVLEQARRVVGEAVALARLAEDESGDGSRRATLTIGTKRGLAEAFMAPALTRFRSLNPAVTVRMKGASGADLLTRLESGDTELVISHERPHADTIEFIPVKTIRRVLIARRDHPVMTTRRLTAAGIAEHALILPERNTRTFREVFARLSPVAGASGLQIAMEVQGSDARVRYVAEGWGIAIIEEGSHAQLPDNLSLRVISESILPARTVGIYRVSSRYFTGAARAFCKLLMSGRNRG